MVFTSLFVFVKSHSVNTLKLQEQCRKLHKQIDLVDEERYDMEVKVAKSNKEVLYSEASSAVI